MTCARRSIAACASSTCGSSKNMAVNPAPGPATNDVESPTTEPNTMQAAQKLEGTAAPQSTARAELDATIKTLRAHATEWARSPISERIALARKMLDGYVEVAEASVLAGCHA